jgi:hypothetical protein
MRVELYATEKVGWKDMKREQVTEEVPPVLVFEHQQE